MVLKVVKAGDSKKKREIDRIVVWTFNIARDLPSGTICKKWVANFVKRSEKYVKKTWNNNPYEKLLEEEEEEVDKGVLSQESKEIIRGFLFRQRKQSIRTMIAKLEQMLSLIHI